MKLKTSVAVTAAMLTGLLGMQQAFAAIALDRTRVIFNGDQKSISLSVSNQNKELPYLAQGWIEDAEGNKVTSPLMVLPPLQRVEPGAKSQVKIQAAPEVAKLPQDRESLFYFNLREIPPKSSKPNTLQIALQTRIKLFYRPATLVTRDVATWQAKLTLTRVGDRYQVNNPTPYFITLASASASLGGKDIPGVNPVMVAPKGNVMLGGSAAALGSAPVLTYINDYGGRPKLVFGCSGATCSVRSSKAG
ncbi:Chaperone protein papD precursor [Serratia quinivorans]|uniref:fimbria/pilus periplasmic chaperone n=1 Tax=Serratia quinivorans TaxID=137545 RepID=UPI0021784987|nr:fimbria/pilus periplasmic chaperone [Serratia quinivorans]CAI0730644.1 Chaperone protein papD precursor [Serratia quinivorans]CAI0753205.1 Chaperone protein papD precursor [Serratia quinivorans]CAI1543997.1 Chaperone protein papD precursor [Serratia quinivorans]CAI2044565.1 Chaperone protein papD precursor [Serratia quinivorans]CAI2409085.1 Chaperone protein papD precursor [Serratia quinivorans]